MTEQEMEDAVTEALDYVAEVEDGTLAGASVRTFADAGVMTMNKGVVVTLTDGSVFQLTVVRSA